MAQSIHYEVPLVIAVNRRSRRRVIAGWYQRYRQRRQLLTLDHGQLKDVGITVADAQHEGRKPFWVE